MTIFERIHQKLCPLYRYFKKKLVPNPWIVLSDLEKTYEELKAKGLGNNPYFKNFERYFLEAKNEICTWRVNYVYYWRLTHRAKAELVMLKDRNDLIQTIIDLIYQIDSIVDDEELKKIWLGADWDISYLSFITNNSVPKSLEDSLGILPRSLIKLQSREPISNEEITQIKKYVKKVILMIYDYFIDRSIYNLVLSYLYLNVSTFILLLISIAFSWIYIKTLGNNILYILVAGALGAMAGNIVSYRTELPKEVFLMAIRGYLLRPFIYHIFGKGIVGAFAAALAFIAIKGGFIVSLDMFQNKIQKYVITIVSFSAGFSGIALLNRVVDRVLGKLTLQLEKVGAQKIKQELQKLKPPTSEPTYKSIPRPTYKPPQTHTTQNESYGTIQDDSYGTIQDDSYNPPMPPPTGGIMGGSVSEK
jgi:hypothetical protein